MRRVTGVILLGLVWAAVVWRVNHVLTIHGTYGYVGSSTERLVNGIDALLVTPPMKLLKPFVSPNDHWPLYLASTATYLLAISAAIYILLIRKKSRDGTSTARKALS